MPNKKTLSDLQAAIGGFMNRQPRDFVVNGRDNLLRAINNAKDFLQRAIDFEYAKASVLVPNVYLPEGGNLDNAILYNPRVGAFLPGPDPIVGGYPQFPDPFGNQQPFACPSPSMPQPCQPPWAYSPRCPPQYPGGPCPPIGYPLYDNDWDDDGFFVNNFQGDYDDEYAGWNFTGTNWRTGTQRRKHEKVDVKRPLRGYLPFIDNTGVAPISIISKQEWAARRQRLSLEFTSLRINEAKALLAATGFAIVMDGKKFFVDPQSPQVFGWQAAFNVYFDVIRWIEDFRGNYVHYSGQFLLDYCFDVLLFRSCYELNLFLKEDERVVVNRKVYDEVWNNVVQWNATIFANTTDVSLD